MELGIIPLKQMIELVQLRWFGHGVKWGTRHIPKWPGKLECREEIQMKTLTESLEEGMQKILKEREIQWHGVRAITITLDCK